MAKLVHEGGPFNMATVRRAYELSVAESQPVFLASQSSHPSWGSATSHLVGSPAGTPNPDNAFSIISLLASPSNHSPGIPDSPQYAPASCPQTAPVVSASLPRFTARKTAWRRCLPWDRTACSGCPGSARFRVNGRAIPGPTTHARLPAGPGAASASGATMVGVNGKHWANGRGP